MRCIRYYIESLIEQQGVTIRHSPPVLVRTFVLNILATEKLTALPSVIITAEKGMIRRSGLTARYTEVKAFISGKYN